MTHRILIYILCGTIGLLLCNNWLKERAINNLTAQNTTLEKDLKASISISGRKIIYKTRTLAGEVKTIIKYLPPEGGATINQSATSGEIDLRVKARGLTFKPALAGLFGPTPQIGVEARLAYWNRYGAGLGVGFNNNIGDTSVYVMADRRADDLLPWFDNLAIGGYAGSNAYGPVFGLGIKSYL